MGVSCSSSASVVGDEAEDLEQERIDTEKLEEADSWLEQAREYREDGRYQEALDAFVRALQLRSDFLGLNYDDRSASKKTMRRLQCAGAVRPHTNAPGLPHHAGLGETPVPDQDVQEGNNNAWRTPSPHTTAGDQAVKQNGSSATKGATTTANANMGNGDSDLEDVGQNNRGAARRSRRARNGGGGGACVVLSDHDNSGGDTAAVNGTLGEHVAMTVPTPPSYFHSHVSLLNEIGNLHLRLGNLHMSFFYFFESIMILTPVLTKSAKAGIKHSGLPSYVDAIIGIVLVFISLAESVGGSGNSGLMVGTPRTQEEQQRRDGTTGNKSGGAAAAAAGVKLKPPADDDIAAKISFAFREMMPLAPIQYVSKSANDASSSALFGNASRANGSTTATQAPQTQGVTVAPSAHDEGASSTHSPDTSTAHTLVQGTGTSNSTSVAEDGGEAASSCTDTTQRQPPALRLANPGGAATSDLKSINTINAANGPTTTSNAQHSLIVTADDLKRHGLDYSPTFRSSVAALAERLQGFHPLLVARDQLEEAANVIQRCDNSRSVYLIPIMHMQCRIALICNEKKLALHLMQKCLGLTYWYRNGASDAYPLAIYSHNALTRIRQSLKRDECATKIQRWYWRKRGPQRAAEHYQRARNDPGRISRTQSMKSASVAARRTPLTRPEDAFHHNNTNKPHHGPGSSPMAYVSGNSSPQPDSPFRRSVHEQEESTRPNADAAAIYQLPQLQADNDDELIPLLAPTTELDACHDDDTAAPLQTQRVAQAKDNVVDAIAVLFQTMQRTASMASSLHSGTTTPMLMNGGGGNTSLSAAPKFRSDSAANDGGRSSASSSFVTSQSHNNMELPPAPIQVPPPHEVTASHHSEDDTSYQQNTIQQLNSARAVAGIGSVLDLNKQMPSTSDFSMTPEASSNGHPPTVSGSAPRSSLQQEPSRNTMNQSTDDTVLSGAAAASVAGSPGGRHAFDANSDDEGEGDHHRGHVQRSKEDHHVK